MCLTWQHYPAFSSQDNVKSPTLHVRAQRPGQEDPPTLQWFLFEASCGNRTFEPLIRRFRCLSSKPQTFYQRPFYLFILQKTLKTNVVCARPFCPKIIQPISPALNYTASQTLKLDPNNNRWAGTEFQGRLNICAWAKYKHSPLVLGVFNVFFSSSAGTPGHTKGFHEKFRSHNSIFQSLTEPNLL